MKTLQWSRRWISMTAKIVSIIILSKCRWVYQFNQVRNGPLINVCFIGYCLHTFKYFIRIDRTSWGTRCIVLSLVSFLFNFRYPCNAICTILSNREYLNVTECNIFPQLCRMHIHCGNFLCFKVWEHTDILHMQYISLILF